MKPQLGGIKRYWVVVSIGLCAMYGQYGAAGDQLRFFDITLNPGAGLNFSREAAPNNALLDAIKASGEIMDIGPRGRAFAPVHPHGAPGAALLDYDNDGDLDIYVSNAVGTANSLYSNQLKESGTLTFVDKAAEAGVAATDQDTTGMCFGDIDNDGDHDLYVVGNFGTGNRLFENLGGGRFADISIPSGTRQGDKHPSSCAMGDINGDGLLDIAVGNTFDNWENRLPLVTFDNSHLNESDTLFLNLGANTFSDISESAGINMPRRITWAISLVDYDLDGDLDLIAANDQGAKAPAVYGGVDDGYIRIYNNDGSGRFIDLTEVGTNTNRAGAWMSLSFGDLNHDGLMDIFSTNVGYYLTAFMSPVLDFPVPVGDWQSGWFLGQADGSFEFPGVGAMLDNPFGWGSSIVDYDNDGDSDIIYHGGMNMGPFADASNAGVVLANDGRANFTRDALALSESTDHARRMVHGVSVGDLNQDGFMDIVSVSSEDWPQPLPLVPYVPDELKIGTPFDSDVFTWPIFVPVDPTDLSQGFVWSQLDTVNGSLSVEVSNAGSRNHSVRVDPQGSKGLIEEGKVNRDGIGAVITFTPQGGKPVMWPVTAGSSHLSQEALEWVFGMGRKTRGVLDVMWPGGVRNRLYRVRAGEHVLLPEIPCSYDDKTLRFREYFQCVENSLTALKKNKVLSQKQKYRFLLSAVRAYIEARFR